ncbi:MAG: Subtilisin DY, partial [Gemmatimonadales bacterium]
MLLSGPPTRAQLAQLGAFGAITGRIVELHAVFLRGRASALPAIQALPFVVAANPDAERLGSPVDAVSVGSF